MSVGGKGKGEFLVVSVTDVHGRYLSCSTLDDVVKDAGLDRLHSYLNEKRALGFEILLLDNGDSLQGLPLVDLHDFQGELAHPMNITHRLLGFDAFILGNHEFNFGLSGLKQLQSSAPIPWLGANIRDQHDGSAVFGEFEIFEKAGLKVGVLGLITEFVPRWEHHTMIPGLVFENIIDRAQQIVPQLRKECDFLVVSYHGGCFKDPETAEPWCHDARENQAEALLAAVPGIDLLLTGHQHRKLVYRPADLSSPWMVQGGAYGQCWAEVHVKQKGAGQRAQVVGEPQLITSNRYPICASLEKAMAAHIARTKEQLSTPLGTADPSFQIHDPMAEVWLKKHPMIQWVNQLIAKKTGAPIVCTSLLDSHLPGLPEQVTVKDILKNYFFMDNLCVIQVTGQIFREALEQVGGFFSLQKQRDGLVKLSVNGQWQGVQIPSYNYDIFDGIEYKFDLSKPVGKRLTSLIFEGKEVQDQDQLRIGLTTYRAQGAFYQMFKPEQIIAEFPGKITDLMIADLQEKGHLHIELIQNFEVQVPDE